MLELECINRMHLNAYQPKLTSEGGIAAFCRGYLGHRFDSTRLLLPCWRFHCWLFIAPDVGPWPKGPAANLISGP